jgi:hypothetical protein
MLIASTKKRRCPYLLEPFDNCYCVRMDSQDIERAVNLCSNNFEHCGIYMKKNETVMAKIKEMVKKDINKS